MSAQQLPTTCMQVKRPAGWVAFLIIGTIANLMLGFLLAIMRCGLGLG
jgi:hypothetical protein